MVAQAFGAATPSPATWGRTSPIAAATAVKQQPMDLVKRKASHSGLGVNAHELDVPSGSVDKARLPQVSLSTSYISPFQGIQELGCSKISMKQRKREIMDRWRLESSQFEKGNEQSSQVMAKPGVTIGTQNQPLFSELHQPLCSVQHQSDKRDTTESGMCVLKTKQNNDLEVEVSICIQENNKDHHQTQEASCTLENRQDNLQTKAVADKDKIVEDVYKLLSGESNLDSYCETDRPECRSQEQQKQLIITQSEDEWSIHVNKKVSEEESRKPSVEYGNLQLSGGIVKVNEPQSKERQGEKTVQQNPSALQAATEGNVSEEITKESCVSVSNSSEEEDTDSNIAEYDQGDVLIIADGDCQVVSLDSETENCETVTEILSSCGIDKQDCYKEDEDNIDHTPRSRSRSESHRKMKEGKDWLLENLQLVKDTKHVIQLGSIERLYSSYCKENNKEPLATPVLARLIHSTFPDATKCRLGARKHQRIHYRRLQLKSDVTTGNQLIAEPTKDNQIKTHTSSLIQIGNGKDQREVNSVLKLQQSFNKIDEANNKFTQSIVNNDVIKQTTSLHELEEVSPQKPQNQSDPIQNDEENCKRAAKKVKEVLQWITSQGEPHKKALLRDFAHSASCQKLQCVPICLMFRRIRRHVVAAQHSCSVLRLYSMLLRHHVSSCTQANCGLPACPALRNTLSIKRKQEQPNQPSKRMSAAPTPRPYPSSFVLTPRSPGGSLPGSPVNSPPSSPNSYVGMTPMAGQIQYVIMPVLMSVVENQAI